MTNHGWKQAERRIARLLGGDRSTSPQQTSAEGTTADAVGIPEYLEVKNPKTSRAWQDLADLHEKAQRYDRAPVIVYDAVDGPSWVAMWLERYIEDRHSGGRIDLPHMRFMDVVGRGLFQTRVGQRLPHRALVEDTIMKAEREDRPPLVVIQKKRSPRKVALVPLGVHGSREESGHA